MLKAAGSIPATSMFCPCACPLPTPSTDWWHLPSLPAYTHTHTHTLPALVCRAKCLAGRCIGCATYLPAQIQSSTPPPPNNQPASQRAPLQSHSSAMPRQAAVDAGLLKPLWVLPWCLCGRGRESSSINQGGRAGAGEQRSEHALQRLAARLQRGAAGQPLLPEQEAAALVQRVGQQLVLRERLAQQLEGRGLESFQFVFRGCSIEMSEEYV